MISILAQSVITTWLYDSSSGSLPVVILFHAAVNTAGRGLWVGPGPRQYSS